MLNELRLVMRSPSIHPPHAINLKRKQKFRVFLNFQIQVIFPAFPVVWVPCYIIPNQGSDNYFNPTIYPYSRHLITNYFRPGSINLQMIHNFLTEVWGMLMIGTTHRYVFQVYYRCVYRSNGIQLNTNFQVLLKPKYLTERQEKMILKSMKSNF